MACHGPHRRYCSQLRVAPGLRLQPGRAGDSRRWIGRATLAHRSQRGSGIRIGTREPLSPSRKLRRWRRMRQPLLVSYRGGCYLETSASPRSKARTDELRDEKPPPTTKREGLRTVRVSCCHAPDPRQAWHSPHQAPVKPDRKNQGTKKDPTCKRCGRRKVSDGQAKGKHGCRVKKTSKAYCKVAEEMYLPGYPKAGYFIEE